jgi:fluoroacetyl-CoA thioesterase
MSQPIRIGTAGEERFIVGDEHVITFADAGMPAVLSTPTLVGLLEQTARKAIQPLLPPGHSSVGVMIELEHLAPTPPGREVVCRARVIYVDGPRITFQLEAVDEHEPIARGTHKRHIVETTRLERRVARKRPE